MAECETSQVGIQKFKLKKSLAALVLHDIHVLEEDGKIEHRRGKTRGWIRKREEKGFFNNVVQELMIEDTLGSHGDFLKILKLVEPGCILLQWINQKIRLFGVPFPCLSFN